MTREEEIRQAAINHICDDTEQLLVLFEEGAKWADKHPNPDTIKKIFKFALEKTNFMIADSLESIDWEVLIKKAME